MGQNAGTCGVSVIPQFEAFVKSFENKSYYYFFIDIRLGAVWYQCPFSVEKPI